MSMLRLLRISYGFVLLFCFPEHLNAGAWTLPKEAVQRHITYRYYSTNEFFDLDGDKRDKNGSYSKHEINQYTEYGWNNEWTIGTSVFFGAERDRQELSDVQAGQLVAQERIIELQGMNRADIFARYQLYRDDVYAFAVQPLITLPSVYFSSVPTSVVEEKGALELGLLMGRNFHWLGRSHYADMKLAYRHRFEANDQILIEGHVGISVAEKWVIMPEFQHIASTETIDRNLANIAGENNFELTKLQLSALYKVTDDVALQWGAFVHAQGKNTGAGDGIMLSVWMNF